MLRSFRYTGVSWPSSLLVIVAVGFVGLGIAALLLVRRRARHRASTQASGGTGWRPAVQHVELPAPTDDPIIAWAQPQIEQFVGQALPLSHVNLKPGLRGQLDGYALGRAKRILEAPDLLSHAAADPESWPHVEAAVNATLALLSVRGAELLPDGARRLNQALALCAAQGVLLAEWRQLEDGRTAWTSTAAQVRASDAFTIQRIAESMQRQLLPDLFAGIAKRPPDLEIPLLVPFTISTAFYMRLHGAPPKAFAA